ncbi:hypothetical protein HMPREF1137_0321 [Actinomyces sp. ICM39]|nr:hypothetical protein HMPREF1137_0321 [Actinomyces sp. ICM39]
MGASAPHCGASVLWASHPPAAWDAGGCEAGCSPQASGVPAVSRPAGSITWRRSRC